MRYLVIHAHPDPESFSRAVRDATVASLTRSGHVVDVIDLYADGFDPRMTEAERLAYETQTPILDPAVADYARRLQSAEGLVFVYPTWWWGLPAILKGWLERVLVPGVGFVLDPTTNKVKPGLGHLRRVIGITTYGSSQLSTRIFNDAGRRVIMRCVRVLAPLLRCRTTWLALYRMDTASAADRDAFLRRVDRVLAAL